MRLVVLLLLSLVSLACAFDPRAKPVASPISTEKLSELQEYWTPERMASAIPRTPIINKDEKAEKADFYSDYNPEATPISTEAHPPGKKGEVNVSAPFAYPFPYSSAYAPSYTAYPWSAVGKIFFTTGGLNYVCSGATVNQYIIYTAGHCVFNLATASWVTNFVFVPGYNNGAYTYAFASYQMWAPTGYTGSSAASPARGYDVAVVALQKQSTIGVGNLVGWFGASWNQATSQTWTALGYPQASPFNGAWDYYCVSALGVIDSVYSPVGLGIGCDATGGSSGGPWVLGFGSTNQINSVNGYKYTAQPLALYGAYFGTAAYNLYVSGSAVVPPF